MSKLIALLLLVFLASPVRAETFDSSVFVVHDGDTIKIESPSGVVQLRLAYIDAPEIKQVFGIESRDALRAFLLNKVIKVDTTKSDQYGRKIATITTPDGSSVNDWMIANGFAWHYSKFDNKTTRKAHAALQAQAVEKHLGLWSTDKPVEPWNFRKQEKSHVAR